MPSDHVHPELNLALVDAVARRVVELLREDPHEPRELADAATVARIYGVDRSWVYANAERLGATRLGDGPKPRLRFDLATVARALVRDPDVEPKPRTAPTSRRRRRARAGELDLLPVRR